MDKAVFCLVLLAATCCSLADVNSEEFVRDTTATTPVHTTQLTEISQPIIVDSTSDSLLDIYPHLTEFFTTTTPTAAPEENDEPASTAAPGEHETSDLPAEDGGTDSSAVPGEDGGTDSPAAPGEDGGTDLPAAPGEDGGTDSPAAPGEDGGTDSPAAPGEDGGTDLPAAPGEDGGTDSPAAPGEDGGTDSPAAPGEDGGTDLPAALGEDGGTDSPAAPGEHGGIHSPGEDGEHNSTAAPGEDGGTDLPAAPGEDGGTDSPAAPGEDEGTDSPAAPGDDGEHNSTAAPGEDGELDSTAVPQDDGNLNEDDVDLASSSESVCGGELSPFELQSFEKAMNAFSKDLLKQVKLVSQDPNVAMSPFSITLGLLQLALGAENQTEKMIMETLHVESLQCLHEKLQKVTKRLTETSLNIATRMYVKKEFPIKQTFLKRSAKLYGTKPVNLKQHMKQNVEAINKWVKDATRGNIPHFLSNVPSNVVLMLLNAIHFKGMWRNRFDPTKTVPDVFNINDEEMVMVEMMQSARYPLSYFVHEKLDSQVARLPFKGNMSFVIIMPNNMNWNLSRILVNLNRTELYTRFHKEKPTSIKIPKLNLDFKLELTHVLSNLGLGQLFSHPNLKGISEEPLFVSSVEHQATLQLNEDGVEAAAATAVVMSRSLSTFSINRPFLYFLFDDITGQTLFQGYVRNPKPGFQKKKKERLHIPDVKNMKKDSIPK